MSLKSDWPQGPVNCPHCGNETTYTATDIERWKCFTCPHYWIRIHEVLCFPLYRPKVPFGFGKNPEGVENSPDL
jgi:hypothetical protein